MAHTVDWPGWSDLQDVTGIPYTSENGRVSWSNPACYQIAVRKPGESRVRVVYVGFTDQIERRRSQHASGKDPATREGIAAANRKKLDVLFRFVQMTTEDEARALEAELLLEAERALLDRFEDIPLDYPWNVRFR
jgi:predicted GIY-YIG superfamily endonuclease